VNFLPVFFLSLFLCLPTLAGDLLQYKQEKESGFFRLYLEPTQMKMDFSEDGKSVKSTMVYVKETQTATMIDHGSKKFTSLDKKTIENMAAKMGPAMAKMKEAMKKMPPEMQKMMKEKMGALGGSGADQPIEVKKAGRGESVGRWKAARYELIRGKTVVAETWTVPMKEIGVDPKNFEILQEMSKLYEGLGQELKNMIGSAGAVDMQSWKKMEGFPVKTVSHQGKGEKSYVLDSVEKKSFSSSDFAVPTGYTKQDFGKM